MSNLKYNPNPEEILQQFKGEFFQEQWPTLPQLFNITVNRFPNNKCFEAFAPEHEVFNYTQAHKIIKSLANFLYSKGVRRGDRIGLSGKNSPEWAMVYLAAGYAGAIIVPVDNALSINEMIFLLNFAEVKLVFADKAKLEKEEMADLWTDAKFSLEKDCTCPFIFDCLIEEQAPIEQATSEDVAAILFTSGTTGNPKGVMLTHKNLVYDCFAAQSLMNVYSTDVFYAILPIHHAYTMLAVFIESISVGANLVFGKKLVVSQIFKEMREAGVTMFLAVPMLYNKLLNGLMKGVKEKGAFVNGLIHFLMGISGFIKKTFHINIGKKMFGFLLKNIALEKNRICISGGGPLPASTFKAFNQLGIDFVQGYGLTETSPILTLNPVFDYEESSIGKLLKGIECKVVDPDADGNGLLYFKSDSVMKGYYKNPDATAEVLDSDGWINTGDIGHMDSRGFVYLTGRAKNIIVTEGGKNVFPEEIEDAFQLYFDIEQICCVGYTIDPVMKTEGVCAIVYPSLTCQATYNHDKNSIYKYISSIVETVNKNSLHPHQRIRKIVIANEPLEITSTKKVKRFIVAQQYKELINAK